MSSTGQKWGIGKKNHQGEKKNEIDILNTKPELKIEEINTFEDFVSRGNGNCEGHKFKHAEIKTGSVLEDGCQHITLICCDDRQTYDETTQNILLRSLEIWESKRNEMTEGSIALV